MPRKCDFSGWATRNDLLCADGRTIRRNAFKSNDGQTVPLVWNHQHNDPDNVLGHALLENRDEGVYAYCDFNDTESGKMAKELVQHGDVRSLSIFANQLKQSGSDVLHGMIREVSLVLAGANPGAFIDSVLAHGDSGEEAGIIADYDQATLMLYHSDEDDKKPEEVKEEPKEEKKMPEEKKDGEETVQDVIDSMNEKQKNVMYALVGQALEEGSKETKEEEKEVKHNLFDVNEKENQDDVLMHDGLNTIIADGKRFGSLKESFLAHAEEYGIENIDYLFPEAKATTNVPEFIKRKDDWVSVVMNGIHHVAFSRIKSVFADITEDEARAKGYIKGNLKKDEVFSLLKRTTTPTTVYKKQKLDRDDVIDITDFDVVSWLKTEMRMMLDEELARAFLFGDGRLASSDDKINEANIRPIASDAALFTVSTEVTPANGEELAHAIIKAAIKSRKNYRGSGNPIMFTTEDQLADMLLLEDNTGRELYKTEAELATKMRVSKIVTVPDDVMPSGIYALIVNLNDYNVGADKGGAVNMFDDFDIDYNQQKYLIETRCSGALVKPYSAIVLKAHSEG